MIIYDITVPITTGMPVWPGDLPVQILPILRIAKGDNANVSLISMATHTGTHIDPPYHFLDNGLALEGISLKTLIGPAIVAYLPEAKSIGKEELEGLKLPEDCQRLLLRTKNSLYWANDDREFHHDYVGLSEDAAKWLVSRDIQLVGIDYLGIHRFDSDAKSVHCILLEAGITIIEGLNLASVAPGCYQLICLPLRIAGADGAPVRAILIAD